MTKRKAPSPEQARAEQLQKLLVEHDAKWGTSASSWAPLPQDDDDAEDDPNDISQAHADATASRVHGSPLNPKAQQDADLWTLFTQRHGHHASGGQARAAAAADVVVARWKAQGRTAKPEDLPALFDEVAAELGGASLSGDLRDVQRKLGLL